MKIEVRRIITHFDASVEILIFVTLKLKYQNRETGQSPWLPRICDNAEQEWEMAGCKEEYLEKSCHLQKL